MDLPQGENARSNKALFIGGAVLLVLIAAAIVFVVTWRSNKPSVAPSLNQNANSERGVRPVNAPPANVPTEKVPPLPAGNGAYFDVQPGLDRPLTADEKVKYHFPSAANVWIKTTSPADGTKPDVYFYQGQSLK